jgi:RNA polymerase sigma-70 factor (ECF subfamily)
VAAEALRIEGVTATSAARVNTAAREHTDSMYRLLRRMGVPENAAEDALQKVFVVLARRIDTVEPGRERAYLSGIALRVARAVRASLSASRESADEEAVASARAPEAGPDDQLDDRRARALLDGLLEEMTLDLRTVFILYELEEMTMAEIAAVVDIPPGTVASRLRRARDEFARLSRRLKARTAEGEVR